MACSFDGPGARLQEHAELGATRFERGFSELTARGDRRNQRFDVILTAQEQDGELAVHCDFARSNAIERSFDDVDERYDHVQAEKTGRAFDRVRDTEDRIDHFRACGLVLAFEQSGFHLAEQLAAFVDEDL